MSAGHTAVTDQVSDPHPAGPVADPSRLEPCGLPEHPDCGIRDVLDRLGDSWSVLVLAELSGGTRRFGELQRNVHGVSQRMLTLTVRRLERDGLVLRTVYATVPATVTYELTDLGRSLASLVRGLADWSLEHRADVAASRDRYDRGDVR